MVTSFERMSPLLHDLRVVEIGGRSAAVFGELFAQLGADVLSIHRSDASPDVNPSTAESFALGANKRYTTLSLSDAAGQAVLDRLLEGADLAVLDLTPGALDALHITPHRFTKLNPRLVVAAITPFGLTGPRRDYLGSDLISFHASGIARLLVGHVDNLEREPPVRASGGQSAFIAGLTAACAAMHALYQQQRSGVGQIIDVSTQEALAMMAPRELAMPGFGGQPAPRAGRQRGGSAVIPVLPALDGYVAISPRETHQWARWLELMGNPAWSAEPRFSTRAQRAANYDELFELMAQWSRTRRCAEIFTSCQEAHVPCFPFGSPGDMLHEEQLLHRRFFATSGGPHGAPMMVPGPPFGLPASDYAEQARAPIEGGEWLPRPASAYFTTAAGVANRLPLDGIRVLDFSWVIAGPTSTRYLALMGAEVVKIEAPDRPDTGRVSELHDVLGQSKLGLSLDLRADGALKAVHTLLEQTDVVVENFATGVMERLGLGYNALTKIRPEIVLLSASGLGRTGPGSGWVAYGNLLSAYSGFAALNGSPGEEPRTGLAWADPLCGLFMAFAAVAALRNRDQGGGGRHIDFSMLEGLLWTMPGALLGPQITGVETLPEGNHHPTCVPHGVFRAAGEDGWLAIAVTNDTEWRSLCAVVPTLADVSALPERSRRDARGSIDRRLSEWVYRRDAMEAMEELQTAGVPASASYTTNDLFGDDHLWEREFYKPVEGRDSTLRFLPGLPWRWGDGTLIHPQRAPGLGEHTERVLRELGGLSAVEFGALKSAGAFGQP